MKDRIKSGLFFLLYYSGLERLLARFIRVRGVAVLMYHGVCDQATMPPEINFHLPREVFVREMRALKVRYRVIPLSGLVAALASGEVPEKSLVLTFDDGYRNNATLAAPVMKQLGLTATVFVTTACVDSGRWMPLNQVYWLWSEGKLTGDEMKEYRRQLRTMPASAAAEILAKLPAGPDRVSEAAHESFAMLSWDEIREMSKAGFEFGSHTHTHCNMAVEDEASQSSQLETSKRLLEQHLGAPPTLFAYPYGRTAQMSEASRRNVIKAGYRCAISAEYGLVSSGADLFSLPRLGYDRRIWMFCGEILYQFAKQALRDLWCGFTGRAKTQNALAK